jgi:small conductance mechanosensitive channel
MEQLTDKIVEWGAFYGTRVLGALVILILGRLLAGMISRMVRKLMERTGLELTLTTFVTTLVRIALLVFVVVAALHTLGVQTTSVIAVIGAAGLAVGFALQGSLANFASGVILIVLRPFKAGDLVEAGGILGKVKEIHIFNTVITTLDNKRAIVPNGKITGDNIINYSSEGVLRVDMVFGIHYGDHIPKAKQILEKILHDDARVLADPAPTVAVSELGDSSVNFVVRPYVKVEDYWGVYFDTTERVKMTFDESGVTIPFPQRDVHLFTQEHTAWK